MSGEGFNTSFFALSPDVAAFLHFADGIWGGGDLAGVVAQVRCHRADVFRRLNGGIRQGGDVAADGDDISIHLIAHQVWGLMDGALHALQKLGQFRQVELRVGFDGHQAG